MSDREMIQDSQPVQPSPVKREPREFPVALAAGAACLLVMIGVVAYIATRPGPPPPPKPTQEAYDYLSKLSITDIHLSAEENMLGHDVVMVDAKITNTGDRVVTALRLRLYFYD